MTVTHDLRASGHRAPAARRGTVGNALRRLVRLLNADWRQASWMIDHSPRSLQETLEDSHFLGWLTETAGWAAAHAAAHFGNLSRDRQQMIVMLVRCYRLGHTPPGWACNYTYA